MTPEETEAAIAAARALPPLTDEQVRQVVALLLPYVKKEAE